MKYRIVKASDKQNEKLRYYEAGYLSREQKENILKSGWNIYDMVDLPREDYVIVERGRINNIGHVVTNIKLELEDFSNDIFYIPNKGLTSQEFHSKYPDAEEIDYEELVFLTESFSN